MQLPPIVEEPDVVYDILECEFLGLHIRCIDLVGKFDSDNDLEPVSVLQASRGVKLVLFFLGDSNSNLGVGDALHTQDRLESELRGHIEHELVGGELVEEGGFSTVGGQSQKVNGEGDVFGGTKVRIVVHKSRGLLVDHIVLAVDWHEFDLLNFALSEVQV